MSENPKKHTKEVLGYKVDELRKEKLPYQQGCALMALAKTERKSTTQMLAELKSSKSISLASDFQHDGAISRVLKAREYKDYGSMTWDKAQEKLREMHSGGKGKDSTRYFALTFPKGTDRSKGDAIGHAVSLSVSKFGSVSVMANNSDRRKDGAWISDQSKGRPFQKSMSPDHQIQFFGIPDKKK